MNNRVLHIHTSPLGDTSISREVGRSLRQSLASDSQISDLDLVQHPLPHWTPQWAGSPQAATMVESLLNTDLLILEAPMYNFGIPSSLKAWLDTVAVAGRTFDYTAAGPVGKLVHLNVVIVSSRGGAYGDEHTSDFQEAYLRQILGFLGVTAERIRVVRAERLAMGDEARAFLGGGKSSCR